MAQCNDPAIIFIHATCTCDEHWLAVTEARLVSARHHSTRLVIGLCQRVLRKIDTDASGVSVAIGQADQVFTN